MKPLTKVSLTLVSLEDRTVPTIVGPLLEKEYVRLTRPEVPMARAPQMPGLGELDSLVADAIAHTWQVPTSTTTDQWTFQLPSGTSPEILNGLGAIQVSSSPYWPNTFNVQFSQAYNVNEFPSLLSNFVSPSFYYPQIARQQTPRFIPNDPMFNQQWHLNNTGQSGGVAGNDAKLTTAWDQTDGSGNPIRGTGVQIAIVDDGLQAAHPDFVGNYTATGSWNFTNNNGNPTPSGNNAHGTAAGGVAAARGNNSLGVSGAAPSASLAGIRLIDAVTTGPTEANALSYMRDTNDIYSNSWGPSDNGTYGFVFPEVAAAFVSNTTSGRGGLGNIYTWAAGNGGNGDNVNYDAYANSRYVLAIGASTNTGVRAGYSEPGEAMLVSTYSNGGTLGITTTDISGAAGYTTNDYTTSFGGTSSATPLASGIVALILQANPNLTWRDVRAILAQTAIRIDPTNAGWSQNSAGRWFNENFGFGAIDANAAVAAAKTWVNLGPEQTVSSGTLAVNTAIPDNNPTGISRTATIAQNIQIESVTVRVNIPNHTWRSDLAVRLTSPSGTVSNLAYTRDIDSGDGLSWTFHSLRHWGETSAGNWTLRISDGIADDFGDWQDWSISFHGTDAAPVLNNLETSALSFIENGADLILTSALSISDPSSANMSGAQVRFSSGYVNGEDSLVFTNQNGITGTWNAATGTLSLSGTTTLANYQAALRTVRYRNTSNNPSSATRTLGFRVTDSSSNNSAEVFRNLNVTPVNDAPTLSGISTQNINEDSVNSIVNLTGIAAGGSETQTLTVTASSSNTAIVPNPTVNYTSPQGTGTLSFTPVANANGSVTITVTVQDNGGTANGGINSSQQTFTLNVTAVNDAPSFTMLVTNLIIPFNAPAQTFPNWVTAISSGPPNESAQTVSITVSNNNTSLFTVQPTINASGQLSFTPAANQSGSATVTVTATDSGGTANGGQNSRSQNFTLTIDNGNDAPVLDNSGSPRFTPVPRNYANPAGDDVSSLIGNSITDPDADPLEGIAVMGATGDTNGTWQYSLDAGATWSAFGALTSSSARLLRPQDRIRFVPNLGFMGNVSLSYHAWDQTTGTAGGTANLTSGTGGGTAFSTAFETASLRVAQTLTPVAEDSTRHRGETTWTLIQTFHTDGDQRARRGLAITGVSSQVPGTWQYSLNGGVTWLPLLAASETNALLLRDTDRVRFLPMQEEVGWATIQYRAWDQTQGTRGRTMNISGPNATGNGTAFSAVDDFAFVEVVNVNHRPLLDIGGEVPLTPIAATNTNPAGDTVASLLRTSATDADDDTLGMAITLASRTGGTWQYSTDSGSTWLPIGIRSVSSALLLNPSDLVRFLPNPGTTTKTASFSFKAWDRTSGVAGSLQDTRTATMFSTATETANLRITATPPALNTAPSLDNSGSPMLPSVQEDIPGTGITVQSLLGSTVTDPDLNALRGIAITGITNTANGRWQYSLNNGASWVTLSIVSPSRALLLSDLNRVRFLPNANYSGTATITYQAWDRTRGTAGQRADLTVAGGMGGTSPFSTASETASVTVNAVNDAPVLNTLPNTLISNLEYMTNPTDPQGQTVGSFADSLITDVDAGALKGIAIVATTSRGSAGSFGGGWQYQINGSTDWLSFPTTLNDMSALVLASEDRIRLIPLSSTVTATIAFKAWDRTNGSLSGNVVDTRTNSAFSRARETATLFINSVNDRPILDTRPTPTMTPIRADETNSTGTVVSQLLGSSVTDYDEADPRGIAITTATSTRGRWQYSLDNGSTWIDVGLVRGTSALLLRATDRIRFVPNSGLIFNGTVTFTFRAWDQSTGTAGSKVNPTSTAFSLASDTAVLSINLAPVLNV